MEGDPTPHSDQAWVSLPVGQPLRGRVGLQPAEHPSRLRAAATEHSPHSTLCVCNIYVFACIHL